VEFKGILIEEEDLLRTGKFSDEIRKNLKGKDLR
jgi:hypothetical protein